MYCTRSSTLRSPPAPSGIRTRARASSTAAAKVAARLVLDLGEASGEQQRQRQAPSGQAREPRGRPHVVLLAPAHVTVTGDRAAPRPRGPASPGSAGGGAAS